MIRPLLPLLLVLGLAASADAARSEDQRDTAPASAIRAAMLLNFVKFVEWPPEHGDPNTRVLCVVDDPAVSDALDTMTDGRRIGGRHLVAKRLRFDAPFTACHVLYVSGLNPERVAPLLDRVRNVPVLTVSDYDRFAPMGGMVHFFVQDGKMRFAINPAAAQRARLKLSSQLLVVATIVKEDHAH